jgi:hypothetical protein
MVDMRKLIDGSEVEEFEKAVDLTIHTKAPAKWLLIDLETGQEYIGSDKPNLYGKWKRIKDAIKSKSDQSPDLWD